MSIDVSRKPSVHGSASGPVSSLRPRSTLPPLPQIAAEVPPSRAAADDAFADTMFERLAAADYEGAHLAAHALLEVRPRDPDALDCAQIAESELRRLYTTPPRVAFARAARGHGTGRDPCDSERWISRRASCSSRVDGVATLHQILRVPFAARRWMGCASWSELFLRRVIAFDSDPSQRPSTASGTRNRASPRAAPPRPFPAGG